MAEELPTPLASERKSGSFTGTDERSHLVPGFLKLPISSRFLLSTLMIGSPCRRKRSRNEEICWNCLSRYGLELVAICFRFMRREKSIWYRRRAPALPESQLSTHF